GSDDGQVVFEGVRLCSGGERLKGALGEPPGDDGGGQREQRCNDLPRQRQVGGDMGPDPRLPLGGRRSGQMINGGTVDQHKSTMVHGGSSPSAWIRVGRWARPRVPLPCCRTLRGPGPDVVIRLGLQSCRSEFSSSGARRPAGSCGPGQLLALVSMSCCLHVSAGPLPG